MYPEPGVCRGRPHPPLCRANAAEIAAAGAPGEFLEEHGSLALLARLGEKPGEIQDGLYLPGVDRAHAPEQVHRLRPMISSAESATSLEQGVLRVRITAALPFQLEDREPGLQLAR